MAYCTDADIRGLLDQADNLLVDNESDFSRQIGVAQSSFIDPYLEAAGVVVPLSSVPTMIRDATAAYTCYLLTRRKNIAGQFSEIMGEFHAEATRLRDDYLNGKSDVPGDGVMPKEYGPLPQAVNPSAG